MSTALFDAAMRLAAADAGRAVPRLLHRINGIRRSAVAIEVTGTPKKGITVTACGPDMVIHTGVDAEGLAAIATAAGVSMGQLGVGPTALFVADSSLTKLQELSTKWARPSAQVDQLITAGSSLVGWWTERFDHPGTSAAVNLITASRAQYLLGVPEGADTETMWRREFNLDLGLPGLHQWWSKLGELPLINDPVRLDHRKLFSTTTRTLNDDDYVLRMHQEALDDGRTWNPSESLHLAAARLNSRCESTDSCEAAMLSDPLWRMRMVHSGHVASGVVSSVAPVALPAGKKSRTPSVGISVRIPRFDTRLRPGKNVIGWIGGPMRVADVSNFFRATVFSTSVSESGVTISLSGIGSRDYRPSNGEEITFIEAPQSDSLTSMRRMLIREKYRERFSWVSQGTTPKATRRGVPLEVIIASAGE